MSCTTRLAPPCAQRWPASVQPCIPCPCSLGPFLGSDDVQLHRELLEVQQGWRAGADHCRCRYEWGVDAAQRVDLFCARTHGWMLLCRQLPAAAASLTHTHMLPLPALCCAVLRSAVLCCAAVPHLTSPRLLPRLHRLCAPRNVVQAAGLCVAGADLLWPQRLA